MTKFIYVECPHCKDYVQISTNEINCGIFRHGAYKKNYKQISPHMPKKECEKLIKESLILGCGKPFKLEHKNDYTAVICDYI